MRPDPSARDADKARRLADQVKADKLRLLYQQSLPAVFLTVFVAMLLVTILWPHANRDALTGWLIAVSIASAARVVLFVSFRRSAPQGSDFLAWERPYFASLLVSSLVWGLGCVWIMPKDSLLHQAITYYFLMGMAGGAISVYSATRLFTITTILIVLMPITLWMLAQGDQVRLLMALAACLLIIAAVRSSKVMANALHQTFLLTHELRASKLAAERLARTDTLTGLNNRRAFIELAGVSISYCQRHGRPISTILLDVDHFKRINDAYGHSTGDQVLQAVAQVLQKSIRRSDICARTGGEEFAILLPDTPLAVAAKVAEKVRLAIAGHAIPWAGEQLRVTVSLGVADGAQELDALMKEADMAMYRAKQAGRNRVVCQEGPVGPSDQTSDD